MRRIILATLLALFCHHATAYAQLRGFEAMRPARSTGNAGLGRSFASGGSAAFLNPATLGLAAQYVMGASYSVLSTPTLEGEKEMGHSLGLHWTDSTPNAFNLSMGLGYNLLVGEEQTTHNVHGALAYTYRSDAMALSLGLGGHWAEDFVFTADGTKDLWSMDAGLGINFLNQFMLGVTGYNVVNNRMEDLPTGVGGGASYWAGPFVVGFDLSAMLDTTTRSGKEKDALLSYVGGVQYMLVQDFFLRAAFRYDADEETPAGDPAAKSIAGGATYIAGQRLAVEVGYQHNLDAPEDFMVGITLELYHLPGVR